MRIYILTVGLLSSCLALMSAFTLRMHQHSNRSDVRALLDAMPIESMSTWMLTCHRTAPTALIDGITHDGQRRAAQLCWRGGG